MVVFSIFCTISSIGIIESPFFSTIKSPPSSLTCSFIDSTLSKQPFIDAVLAYSKYVVVYAQGNNDKYFTNYCNEKNIPMTEISKVVEAKDVLKKMFNLE